MLVKVSTGDMLKALQGYEIDRGKPLYDRLKLDMLDYADITSGAVWLTDKEFEKLADYLI